MKHLNLAAGVLSLLLLGLTAAQPNDNPSALQLEAKSVVIRYLDALLQGDTLTLRSLLGTQLLERRKPLLSNPNYAAHLIRRYQGTQFEITGVFSVTGSKVAVDAQIVLGDHNAMQTRFLLKREIHPGDVVPQLYIVGEAVPGEPR